MRERGTVKGRTAPQRATLMILCAFLWPMFSAETLLAERQTTHNTAQGHFHTGGARRGEAHPNGEAAPAPRAEQPSRPLGPSDANETNPESRNAGGAGEGFRGMPQPGVRPGNGQHLPQWFAQHQTLSPNQQEDALRREPGFSHLPEGQQQQLIDRLHRLNMEPPAQRQRMMQRNERFEALPPERQQEVRGATQALGQMSPDRQQAVRLAFHDLRNLPPNERQNALNSARFQAEYSPQERTVLGNLLSIEPYQPR